MCLCVCISLPFYFYIFWQAFKPKKVTHCLSVGQNQCVCSGDRSKEVEHTTLHTFVNSSRIYMHPCTQKLPEPVRKVCKTHVLRRVRTSCMWFVFVCLTLFPFLSLFSCPSFFLDFPFPTSSSYQSTDRTSQHTQMAHSERFTY